MLREFEHMDGSHWDLDGFLSGANYSEKTEVRLGDSIKELYAEPFKLIVAHVHGPSLSLQVTLRFALEKAPVHVLRVVKKLRSAVVNQPRFAIVSHVLANTLQFAYQEGLGAKETLDEAREVMQASIDRIPSPELLGGTMSSLGAHSLQFRNLIITLVVLLFVSFFRRRPHHSREHPRNSGRVLGRKTALDEPHAASPPRRGRHV